MSDELIWKDPPPPPPKPRWEVLAEQLKERPGKWAMIDEGQLTFTPWWARLRELAHYEVLVVTKDNHKLLGPREVYARYIPQDTEEQNK